MPQCSTCRFYQEMQPSSERSVGNGHCRRRPPRAPYDAHSESVSNFGIFPTVWGSDWCGEFAPRIACAGQRRADRATAALDAASQDDTTDAAVCGLTRDV